MRFDPMDFLQFAEANKVNGVAVQMVGKEACRLGPLSKKEFEALMKAYKKSKIRGVKK